MMHVLSYYGKPLACGDFDSLSVWAEKQQKKRVTSYALSWSSTKSGHKLLIIQRDQDQSPYTSFGGYEIVEVNLLVDGPRPEKDPGVQHVQ